MTTRPGPFRMLVRTELRLLRRDPTAMLLALALPVLASLVIAAIPAAREASPVFGGASVAQAYTPALTLFAVTMAAVVVMPQTLGSHRESGYLRRLRTTPVPPALLLGAVLTVVAAVGVLAAVVIHVGPMALGVTTTRRPLVSALAVVLAVASFLAVGAVLAALVTSPRVAAGVGNVVSLAMWFCAGMWVPRAQFPPWLRTLADLTPGGAAADLMGAASSGGGVDGLAVVVCLAWTAGCALVATRVFRWE